MLLLHFWMITFYSINLSSPCSVKDSLVNLGPGREFMLNTLKLQLFSSKKEVYFHYMGRGCPFSWPFLAWYSPALRSLSFCREEHTLFWRVHWHWRKSKYAFINLLAFFCIFFFYLLIHIEYNFFYGAICLFLCGIF
jgi:hypothetical protein